MKKKILGLLLVMVLAVTGFGLVGCGGKTTPATPTPEVSYDDNTTPVAVEGSGMLFDLWTVEEMQEGWYPIPEENIAYFYGITKEFTNLVIPAYVTDGEETYKVVKIADLIMNVESADNRTYTGVNEYALGIKTITIPSTVEFVDTNVFAAGYTSNETDRAVWSYLESLEQIILNNRETSLNINLWDYADNIAAKSLDMSVNEYWDAEWTDALEEAEYAAMAGICNYDEAEDLYYLGNPSNPYVFLYVAGNKYYPDEAVDELEATVNSKCKVIGDYAFEGSAITEVVLTEGLVAIGLQAFAGCLSLTNLVIPASVKHLGNNVIWHNQQTNLYIKSSDVYDATYLDGNEEKYSLEFIGADYFYVLASVVDANEHNINSYNKLNSKETFGGEEYYKYQYQTE